MNPRYLPKARLRKNRDSRILCQKTMNETTQTELEQVVAEANAVLATLRDFGARWWGYTVSHRTFEILVGDTKGKKNIVLCLSACRSITGPVEWENQRLEISIVQALPEDDAARWFVIQDTQVRFRAEGAVFLRGQNYDILKHHSLYLPWKEEDTEQ